MSGALAARLAAGETVFAGWCGMGSALVAEMIAREGFAAVCLDMQHGLFDVVSAGEGILAVAAAGAEPIVRVPVGELQTASRMLDAGAAAVIAPMVNSAEAARALAEAAKFPPVGQRSWGPHAALRLSGLDPAAYLATANARTVALAMIETAPALAAIDAICTIGGVDGVFVGPSDLAIALTGRLDPDGAETDAALDRIVAAAARHGRIAGAYCATPARALALAARGYRFLAVGFDAAFLREGARAAAGALAAGRG